MAINWGNVGNGAVTGASAGSSFGPWGAAIGGGAGALMGLFGRDSDPTKRSRELLEQIPEKLRPYFEPYINAGKEQLPGLSREYGSLMNNPNDKLNMIGAGFHESPGYKWALDQGEQAIANAQARGGMAGTKQDAQYSGELANNLANQNYNDFMSRALNMYGMGLSGSQGLAQMGQTAATDYGNTIGSTTQSLAQLAYEREAQKNKNSNNLFSNLMTVLNKQ